MIQNLICSFVGTLAFSIVFNVPRRFYFYCGLTGMFGWLTCCLWRKCPITIFLISGIFPLVPGTYVYFTAFYFVRNDLSMALDKGIMALKLAFAIVLGIVFIVSIPRRFFSLQYWRDRKNKNKVVT